MYLDGYQEIISITVSAPMKTCIMKFFIYKERDMQLSVGAPE